MSDPETAHLNDPEIVPSLMLDFAVLLLLLPMELESFDCGLESRRQMKNR